MDHELKTVAVIGGGIAGISCIEGLIQDFCRSESSYNNIVHVSASKLIKVVVNYQKTGRQLETFDVSEQSIEEVPLELPEGLRYKFIAGYVESIEHLSKNFIIQCDSGIEKVTYDQLCLCIGSNPKRLIFESQKSTDEVDNRIITLRDTSTVNELKDRLTSCRRVAIVGDGGISLELVYKITKCEKVWIVRGDSFGHSFFDSGAAKFLLDSLGDRVDDSSATRMLYTMGDSCEHGMQDLKGPSAGPNWSHNLELTGKSREKLNIVYNDEVAQIVYTGDVEYPLRIITVKGFQFDVDLVVSAIGVTPNTIKMGSDGHVATSCDGGILIDDQMRTSLMDVYAAGDVVSCDNWPKNDSWFQMRLWTQARQMGFYAGRCIAAHRKKTSPILYFNFDCFVHCTSFFGFKLVLLGRFNGQNLDDESAKKCEVVIRVNPSVDFVKLVILEGIVIGAVLLGDSGLEETIENLIHDRIDISRFKEHLLDDTVDIEDYFD